MKKAFFDYLETSTQKERDEMAQELKKAYFEILEDERETFAKVRQNRRSTKARADYLEAVQRVGTAQQFFDILRVDWLELFDEYNEFRKGAKTS